MGRVLSNGLDLIGTGRSPLLESELQNDLEIMSDLAKTQSLTERERLHVAAVETFAKGYAAAFLVAAV